MSDKSTMDAPRARFAEQRLPLWDQLPDLELYMDQVLSLMERYLGSYPGFDRKGLTASMVNNYVKLGVMPPPVKKRYTRAHLAQLIIICVLKSSLSIDSIGRLLAESSREMDLERFYNGFCADFEQSVQEASEADAEDAPLFRIYHAALRAQAEQALVRALLSASES